MTTEIAEVETWSGRIRLAGHDIKLYVNPDGSRIVDAEGLAKMWLDTDRRPSAEEMKRLTDFTQGTGVPTVGEGIELVDGEKCDVCGWLYGCRDSNKRKAAPATTATVTQLPVRSTEALELVL